MTPKKSGAQQNQGAFFAHKNNEIPETPFSRFGFQEVPDLENAVKAFKNEGPTFSTKSVFFTKTV